MEMCFHPSTREHPQVNTWKGWEGKGMEGKGREGKGREGGKTRHKKVACDAITTDTSADPVGSSGAWMALYKGPELRNEEMSLYIHVSSSH